MYKKNIIVTTSWDDGHPLDLKLANVLSKYGIKATFYVPLGNMAREVMDYKSIREISTYFGIGAHTLNHVKLTNLRHEALVDEIRGSKLALENIVGGPVNTFCYPWGEYNWRVKQAVINSGFSGARTTHEFRIGMGKDPFQMPTTMLAYPQKPLIRIRHYIITGDLYGLGAFLSLGINRSWVQLASDLFHRILDKGGIWHLWGHSWEIEENALWGQLEELLAMISNHPEVEYLTNGEVLEKFYKMT